LDQANAGVALAVAPTIMAAARLIETIFFNVDITLSSILQIFTLRAAAL
jgi:hypothetical protein